MKRIEFRAKDVAFNQQLASARALKCSFMFVDKSRLDFLHPVFSKIKTKELTRNFVKFALLCPGSLISRVDVDKFCTVCDEIITGSNIFIHRIRECEKRATKRLKVETETWFVIQKRMQANDALKYLVNQASVDYLKFFF